VVENSCAERAAPRIRLVPGDVDVFNRCDLATTGLDANVRESQLSEMRKGQSAEIVADVLPGVTFRGRVDSLSSKQNDATTEVLRIGVIVFPGPKYPARGAFVSSLGSIAEKLSRTLLQRAQAVQGHLDQARQK
jgi:hypothetical protein